LNSIRRELADLNSACFNEVVVDQNNRFQKQQFHLKGNGYSTSHVQFMGNEPERFIRGSTVRKESSELPELRESTSEMKQSSFVQDEQHTSMDSLIEGINSVPLEESFLGEMY
jgi:predicted secreted protein